MIRTQAAQRCGRYIQGRQNESLDDLLAHRGKIWVTEENIPQQARSIVEVLLQFFQHFLVRVPIGALETETGVGVGMNDPEDNILGEESE